MDLLLSENEEDEEDKLNKNIDDLFSLNEFSSEEEETEQNKATKHDDIKEEEIKAPVPPIDKKPVAPKQKRTYKRRAHLHPPSSSSSTDSYDEEESNIDLDAIAFLRSGAKQEDIPCLPYEKRLEAFKIIKKTMEYYDAALDAFCQANNDDEGAFLNFCLQYLFLINREGFRFLPCISVLSPSNPRHNEIPDFTAVTSNKTFLKEIKNSCAKERTKISNCLVDLIETIERKNRNDLSFAKRIANISYTLFRQKSPLNPVEKAVRLAIDQAPNFNKAIHHCVVFNQNETIKFKKKNNGKIVLPALKKASEFFSCDQVILHQFSTSVSFYEFICEVSKIDDMIERLQAQRIFELRPNTHLKPDNHNEMTSFGVSGAIVSRYNHKIYRVCCAYGKRHLIVIPDNNLILKDDIQ